MAYRNRLLNASVQGVVQYAQDTPWLQEDMWFWEQMTRQYFHMDYGTYTLFMTLYTDTQNFIQNPEHFWHVIDGQHPFRYLTPQMIRWWMDAFHHHQEQLQAWLRYVMNVDDPHIAANIIFKGRDAYNQALETLQQGTPIDITGLDVPINAYDTIVKRFHQNGRSRE